MGKIAKICSLIILCGVLGWSFYIVGSPGHNRELRIDQHRIKSISDVRSAIEAWYKKEGGLPESFQAMLQRAKEHEALHSRNNFKYGSDEYKFYYAMQTLLRSSESEFFSVEYQAVDTQNYTLCTTFHHAWDKRDSYRHSWERHKETVWQHSAGKYCFEFTAKNVE